MMKKTLIAAGLALGAAVFAGPASAVPIEVIFNVVGLGTFTADTGDVTNATTITSGAPNLVAAIIANNIGLVGGTAVTLAPGALPVTVGGVFTKEFETGLGTFLETLTVTSTTPGANSLGVLAVGTISQIVGVGFDPTPVYWSAAFTQNAGQGGQINGSFNNSSTPPPPVNIPEPATLALLGAGLVGLALRRRRG